MIAARLLHGPTDRLLWSGQYESDQRDVLSLQRDVARAIAREAARTRDERVPALTPPTFPNGRHETRATDPLATRSVEEKIALALETEARVRGASARGARWRRHSLRCRARTSAWL